VKQGISTKSPVSFFDQDHVMTITFFDHYIVINNLTEIDNPNDESFNDYCGLNGLFYFGNGNSLKKIN
jgi:hypothetical protein